MNNHFIRLIDDENAPLEDAIAFYVTHPAVIDVHYLKDAALISAVTSNQLAKAEWLLNHRADPDTRDGMCLFYCIKENMIDMATLLVRNGAPVDSNHLKTAVCYRRSELVDLFITEGSNLPTIKDLEFSLRVGDTDTVRVYIEWGLFVKNKSLQRWISDNYDVDLLGHLLHHGGRLTYRFALPMAEQACEKADISTLQLLFYTNGLNVSQKTINKFLFRAVEDGSNVVVYWLLGEGAIPDERLINLAINEGYHDLWTVLLHVYPKPVPWTLFKKYAGDAGFSSKFDSVADLVKSEQ
jgi:hypothetical protein